MTFSYASSTSEQTRASGMHIASFVRPGDLIVLTGDLGAGKTTFTQGFGAGLGVQEPIVSPTFTIAREISTGCGFPLIHVDAYRLGSLDNVLDELEALDLDSIMPDAVTVIEWGGEVGHILSDDYLDISIERPHGADSSHGKEIDSEDGEAPRVIKITPVGSRWQEENDFIPSVNKTSYPMQSTPRGNGES